MKSRKTTTRHYHLRQTRRSGKVPVRQHPMNYWGVTAIPFKQRKRDLVSKPFTTLKRANSFKSMCIADNKRSRIGVIWKNPKVVRLKDSDGDGVPDVADCAPNDATRQGITHKLKKAGEEVKRLSTIEKKVLKEKTKEIQKIVKDREHPQKLTEEEQSRIRKKINELKRKYPHTGDYLMNLMLTGGTVAAVLTSGLAASAIMVIFLPWVLIVSLGRKVERLKKERKELEETEKKKP